MQTDYSHLVDLDPDELSYEELYNRTLTLFDVPYEEVTVATSAGNTHVIVSGPPKGEPVVLMHGMNSSSTMWYPNIKALSQSHRVYAVDDILGAGKSELVNDIETVEQFSDWYFELFEKLNLENPTLVGVSHGGWHATNLAIKRPEKINKLLLLSPVQTCTWLEINVDVVINALFAIIPNRASLRTNMETMSNDADNISPLYIDQFFRAVQSGPSPKFFTDMTPFTDEQLSTLKMPVLLLIGERDHFNNQKSIDRASDIMPNVQAEIIPDSGHFISVDQAELVNDKMIKFIAEKR